MQNPLLDVVKQKYHRANPLSFGIGEDVVVTLKIVEGGRERLQDFEGTVIAQKGSGLDEMFTVRRIVANQGVERIFPMHSPRIVSIKTVRSGKIRRCKLYYLRDRVGKSRRLKAKHTTAAARKAAAATRRAKAQRELEAAEVAAAAQSNTSPDTEMATA